MSMVASSAIEASAGIIVNFGKYRGKLVIDIPSSYLKWLAEECRDERICAAADVEWRWREQNGDHWEE